MRIENENKLLVFIFLILFSSSCSSFSHRKKGTGREEHFGRPLARTKCSSRKWCPDQAHKKGKDIEPDPKHHFLLFLFLSKVKRKREEIVTGALLAPVNDLFGRSLEQFFSRQE